VARAVFAHDAQAPPVTQPATDQRPRQAADEQRYAEVLEQRDGVNPERVEPARVLRSRRIGKIMR